MAKKLSSAELEKLVATFEAASPSHLVALACEKKDLLVELLGGDKYIEFERHCLEVVKALLNPGDAPPGVEDNVTWAAMLLHNVKNNLRSAADAYRRNMVE